MIRQLCTGALALGLMILPVGCGVEDDTQLAQFEKALMAMDKGDYVSATASNEVTMASTVGVTTLVIKAVLTTPLPPAGIKLPVAGS